VKALVIYDSLFGSTEIFAQKMAGVLGADAKAVKIGRLSINDLTGYALILIGSPTQGGKHSPQMQSFLDSIPAGILKNKKMAVFDTRLKLGFVKIFGFAAVRMAKILKEKDADIIAPTAGFFVTTGKHPVILDGEIERAISWAKDLVKDGR
jgi:flavodoxin I